MNEPGPLYRAELFPKLDASLIDLLHGLSDDDWSRPTICPAWSVKDIAAHLLDGNIRRLSVARDGYIGVTGEGLDSHDGLVRFLNRLNAEWVTAARRISPRMLTQLLATTGAEVAELFGALYPHRQALYPVAWAGEEISENWFDIAREYTERWLHQQQIRLAVNRPGIDGRELYHPVLETFLRALPHAYRDLDAPEGAFLVVRITGDAGGEWFLRRDDGRWGLRLRADGPEVTIPQAIAWRLFSRGIGMEEARESMSVAGDERLGWRILTMVAVMA